MKKCLAIGVLSLLLGMLLTAFAYADMPDDILTTSVQLDLSAGSITITAYEDYVAYSQGGVITNSTGGCIIRQSDTSTSVANTITVKATSKSCQDVRITISGLRITSKESCITLYGGYDSNSYANVLLNIIGSNRLYGADIYAEGIYVPGSASITIEGTGSLNADGGRFAVGIGGEGDVIINSGTIVASGEDAADIRGRLIEINGGTVTANGANRIHGGIRGEIVSISNSRVTAEYISAKKLTVVNSNTIDTNLEETITVLKQPKTAAGISEVVLSAAVESYSGVAYQWQEWTYNGTGLYNPNDFEKYWRDLENQTGDTLVVSVAQGNDGKTYRCKITNAWGNIVSTDGAKAYYLAFSQQPEHVETNLGEMVSLVVASTCSNVTYQWERSYDNGASWVEVPGETYATLLVSTTLSESDALYRCVISASNGDQLASNSARITVNSDAVTYTTKYYMEKPDGTGYDLIDQVVTEGTAGTVVTAPTKTFEHYNENTAKGICAGTVAADGSLILSRYYDRATYSISFETNGGSILAPLSAKYGAAISCPTAPSKIGYVLVGWYTDAELTRPYTFTTMPGENITLYAKWELTGAGRGIEYTINGITLRDSGYQPISTIPSGGFYAEVSVTNLSSVTTDTLVLAAYDSTGKMLTTYFLYANPQIGQTFTMGAYIDNSGRNVARIKAFMLPVLGGLVPLAEAVEC